MITIKKHLLLIKIILLVVITFTTFNSYAHEIRPALLNLVERESGVFDVTWKVPALGEKVLGIKPILPEGLKPISPSVVNNVPGAIIEYATYKMQGESLVGETIFIDGLSSVQIDVLVQIYLADGNTYSSLLQPKSPTYIIPAVETKSTISWSYFNMGVIHILSGFDHLLFVLALMLIISSKWKLFKTITAFTIAHSFTLALAALGFVNIPTGPTEAVIALSIVFLAVEIINIHQGKYSFTKNYPWVVAMAFGLFHGLGFAGALTKVGLPAHEIPVALLMFNVGVEAGQILFLSVVLVFMAIVKRTQIKWPLGSWRLMPYTIGSLAAFWTIQRIVTFL